MIACGPCEDIRSSYNLVVGHILETIGLASAFVGIFAYGLWSGRMPLKNGWSISRDENDWGFWGIGVLYLLMACTVIFVGFIEPRLHIFQ